MLAFLRAYDDESRSIADGRALGERPVLLTVGLSLPVSVVGDFLGRRPSQPRASKRRGKDRFRGDTSDSTHSHAQRAFTRAAPPRPPPAGPATPRVFSRRAIEGPRRKTKMRALVVVLSAQLAAANLKNLAKYVREDVAAGAHVREDAAAGDACSAEQLTVGSWRQTPLEPGWECTQNEHRNCAKKNAQEHRRIAKSLEYFSPRGDVAATPRPRIFRGDRVAATSRLRVGSPRGRTRAEASLGRMGAALDSAGYFVETASRRRRGRGRSAETGARASGTAGNRTDAACETSIRRSWEGFSGIAS